MAQTDDGALLLARPVPVSAMAKDTPPKKNTLSGLVTASAEHRKAGQWDKDTIKLTPKKGVCLFMLVSSRSHHVPPGLVPPGCTGLNFRDVARGETPGLDPAGGAATSPRAARGEILRGLAEPDGGHGARCARRTIGSANMGPGVSLAVSLTGSGASCLGLCSRGPLVGNSR